MAETSVDYYAVLGVPAHADAAEITRAYRRALRRLHPDTASHAPEHADEATSGPAAGAALALLHDAFAVLGDPDLRAAYDRRNRPARTARTTRRSSDEPTPAGRPYLTDPPDPPLRAGPVRYRPSPTDRR